MKPPFALLENLENYYETWPSVSTTKLHETRKLLCKLKQPNRKICRGYCTRCLTLAKKKPKVRQLWGKDTNGRFVTRGRNAVATVRGTAWLTRDTCAGTLVQVTKGVVSVHDLVRKRTVLVRAGHRYLARAR